MAYQDYLNRGTYIQSLLQNPPKKDTSGIDLFKAAVGAIVGGLTGGLPGAVLGGVSGLSTGESEGAQVAQAGLGAYQLGKGLGKEEKEQFGRKVLLQKMFPNMQPEEIGKLSEIPDVFKGLAEEYGRQQFKVPESQSETLKRNAEIQNIISEINNRKTQEKLKRLELNIKQQMADIAKKNKIGLMFNFD